MDVEINRGGCLNCPATQDVLSMDTVLYNGFGGYCVKKNGVTFYEGDPNDEWTSFKTLEGIERTARKISANWQVVLNTPLRGATWTRDVHGEWILTETNQGFA